MILVSATVLETIKSLSAGRTHRRKGYGNQQEGDLVWFRTPTWPLNAFEKEILMFSEEE